VRVLVVKMSSLGDVIHTLPALTDAAAALPGIQFDWVVEEAFAEIPAWHHAVDRVIPVALRRWRKRPLRYLTGPEWRTTRASLRDRNYDAVVDAQGLLKSAVISRMVGAPHYGMDKTTVRKRLAALAYEHCVHVSKDMHAVERIRLLFARALAYPLPDGPGDYGVEDRVAPGEEKCSPGLLFFHGSSRTEKLWPEDRWVALAELAQEAGYRVWLPWGNEEEHQRAMRIAGRASAALVLPRQSLSELAAMLQTVSGAVAVDTGLGHLSAVFAVPTVSLYGPTSTRLIGTRGRNQVHLQSPMLADPVTGAAELMQSITPDVVWQALQSAVAGRF